MVHGEADARVEWEGREGTRVVGRQRGKAGGGRLPVAGGEWGGLSG